MTIKYHFFDKNCVIDSNLSDHSNLEEVLKKLQFNFTAINFVSQIHSNVIAVIDDKAKIQGKENLIKADALVTDLPNLAIAIVTADCGPVLLYDEQTKVIAAIHAGWRGAKSDIIKNAVNEMKKLGAKNIKAAIGPMIHQASYQVSQEFFDDFIKEDLSYQKFFINDKNPQHYLFDLPAFIALKLQKCDINEIELSKIDTYTCSANYASYRKATHEKRANKGRNISLIVIN